jgi:hypothetical protein
MKKFSWASVFMVVLLFPSLSWAEGRSRSIGGIDRITREVSNDYSCFYSRANLRDLTLGIGIAGVLANTSIDREFQEWAQGSLRNEDTDEVSESIELLGEGAITIPLYGGAALVGAITRGSNWDSSPGEWGRRSLRAILVGGPPVLVLQSAIGGSRPTEDNSRWRPFHDDNGVSGHSFMGAVPFMVAANMAENDSIRYVLYLGSMLCGWSRVNDDLHYLSQAALGWWIAYLSASCTDRAELREREVLIRPAPVAGGIGVMAVLSF